VSGVVNFIMLDDFEGLRVDTQYSFYQHNNSDDTIQDLIATNAANNPSQFVLPNDHVVDGDAFEATVVMGVNSGDGNGNFTAYAGYRNVDPVLQADRDYSVCAFGAAGDEFSCSGSSTNGPNPNFLNVGPYDYGDGSGWFRQVGGEFIDRDFTSDTFNFNPYNYFQRPDERYTFGAFGHYKVNDHFEPYLETMFMHDRSFAQIAYSGIFGGGIAGTNGGINCDNPFLSAQQQAFLCTANGLSTAATYDADGNYVAGDAADGVLILRRNVDGGERTDDLQHESYRIVTGARGDLFGPFTYDVFGSYSNVSLSETYLNEVSVSKSSKALYAVPSMDGSSIVCAVNVDADPSNDDADCVPYDLFGAGGPSAAASDYINTSLKQTGTTTQQVVSASASGLLDTYGVQSPMATTGVGIAIGGEYRRDTLDLSPDAAYQAPPSSDGFGQGAQALPISGEIDVAEFFGEINVPLIDGRSFFELLSLEAGYRYSDYSTGFTTDTYKVGGEWMPTQDIRFRASYQRAVRAPNVIELFEQQRTTLFDLSAGANGLYDPCAGDFNAGTINPEPSATAAQCANTGVSAAQYGGIADNPAGQFNQLQGGNTALEPETADTYSFGFVATPTFIPGFSFSVDYFSIKVEDLIDSVSPELSLNTCLETGDEYFCGLVNRGAGGTLWANSTGYIVATNLNTGSLETSGVDISANYGFDLGSAGGLSFDGVGTWLDELIVTPLPNSPETDVYDCAGLYGGSCTSDSRGAVQPEWRHKLRATWDTPWSGASLSVSWRYFSAVDVAASSDQPALTGTFAEINETLDSQSYIDLSASISYSGIRFRGGVNNVFDVDPPLSSIVGSGAGNGNTFPQVYDALGRYFFLGLTKDF